MRDHQKELNDYFAKNDITEAIGSAHFTVKKKNSAIIPIWQKVANKLKKLKKNYLK